MESKIFQIPNIALKLYVYGKNRSSHRRCSLRKGILRNIPKLTGKHLCQSLFLNKVAGLRPTTLLKKTLAQVFFGEFCEISKNTSFQEPSLLSISIDAPRLFVELETSSGLFKRKYESLNVNFEHLELFYLKRIPMSCYAGQLQKSEKNKWQSN